MKRRPRSRLKIKSQPLLIPNRWTSSEPITINHRSNGAMESISYDADERDVVVSGLGESFQELSMEHRRHIGEAYSLPITPNITSRIHDASSVPHMELPSSVEDDKMTQTTYGSLNSSRFYFHQQRQTQMSGREENMLSTSVSRFYPQSLPTYIDSEREFVQRKWGDANSGESRQRRKEVPSSRFVLRKSDNGNINESNCCHVHNEEEGDTNEDVFRIKEEEEDDDQNQFLSRSLTALNILESKEVGICISLNDRESEGSTGSIPLEDVVSTKMSVNHMSCINDTTRSGSPNNPDSYGCFDFDLDG